MRFFWDSEELGEVVASVLLPNWKEDWEATPDRIFELKTLEDSWSVQMGDAAPEVQRDLVQLEERLKTLCHLDLATYSPEAVFVHAGVVLTDSGLVVIPARSYSGKSTLVKSLLDLGARYYSDEYAVITADGLVHPFPRALSLRIADLDGQKTPARELGWSENLTAAPINTMLSTRFTVDANWDPRPLTEGQAVLKLLENTVSAQTDPGKAIRHLTTAIAGARAVHTPRGESKESAQSLLKFMSEPIT